MLTNIDQDLVNILTDSEQTYRPDGCLQYTIKIQEIYGELSNARILHGRIRYACILHGELSNAYILHGELK